MKMSAKIVCLAIAAASLSAATFLPASAEPVKQCNNPSAEKTITSKCVTDTNDVGNHKISKEAWAEQQKVDAAAAEQREWAARHGLSRSIASDASYNDTPAGREAANRAMNQWLQDHGPGNTPGTHYYDVLHPTAPVPDWGTHVNYADIVSGKAARGGSGGTRSSR